MLIRKVEQFLRNHSMAATKFGRLSMRDPRFVFALRNGRIPGPETAERVEKWMLHYNGES